jgi:GrpB-like predicted nucleotidyltransferase (UPF0157 family)
MSPSFKHREEPPDPSPAPPERIGASTLALPRPSPGRIRMVAYQPDWPGLFRREAERIQAALGSRALRIEHVGSTSVPGLHAKPTIDILLVVARSADEETYLPPLERARYTLRIREPDWHEHRMLKGPDTDTNLHVFSRGCPEIERILRFRDWLRTNAADRDLYARTKLALARKQWKHIESYADAKTAMVEEILSRAHAFRSFKGA